MSDDDLARLEAERLTGMPRWEIHPPAVDELAAELDRLHEREQAVLDAYGRKAPKKYTPPPPPPSAEAETSTRSANLAALNAEIMADRAAKARAKKGGKR